MKAVVLAPSVFMCLAATSANAVVIYDEAIDGDAPAGAATVTVFADLGTLTNAANTLIGTLDAGGVSTSDGSDEFDEYRFVATGIFNVDLASIVRRPILLALFQGSSLVEVSPSLSVPTFAAIGPQASGEYFLRLLPLGNTGQLAYSVTINVDGIPDVSVPVPGTLTLLALVLAGVGYGRSKRFRSG